jgi:hypothetical protein
MHLTDGIALYNEDTGSGWQLSEINNNDFACAHIIATTDNRHPIMVIMGQEQYTSGRNARTGAGIEMSNLSLGGLSSFAPEWKPIATFIYQTGTTKSNAVKSSFETTEDGDYVDWRVSEFGVGSIGLQGEAGDSAYDIAVANGFVGTETDWLLSLQGSGEGGSVIVLPPEDNYVVPNGNYIPFYLYNQSKGISTDITIGDTTFTVLNGIITAVTTN